MEPIELHKEFTMTVNVFPVNGCIFSLVGWFMSFSSCFGDPSLLYRLAWNFWIQVIPLPLPSKD